MDTKATNPLGILMVGDPHDSVMTVQRLLSHDGHLVVTAKGFGDALALARFIRFDVLLCDLRMPGKDGCSLLAQLNSIYPIRSIALTGYVPAGVKRFAETGFDNTLSKPVDMDRLRSVLEGFGIEVQFDRYGSRQSMLIG